jgi:hypothetical protein
VRDRHRFVGQFVVPRLGDNPERGKPLRGRFVDVAQIVARLVRRTAGAEPPQRAPREAKRLVASAKSKPSRLRRQAR